VTNDEGKSPNLHLKKRSVSSMDIHTENS